VAQAQDQAKPSLREPLVAYGAAIVIAAGLFWMARVATIVDQLMHGLIACTFLLAPRMAARLSGRPFDERAAGITLHPWRVGLRVLGAALLITWPAFVAAFFLYYGTICTGHGLVRSWAAATAPMCASWHGWAGFHLRLPDGFVVLLLSQILVVAVPEELFFRGYLMSRLEDRWPSRARFLGTAVGLPLLLSSVLFAVGHFLVDLAPARLAVFFPALVFGWMRSRSGSIAPGALFHALCNVLSEVLHDSAF
jgi:membrane protease YdiL (CAAX protease family)